MRNEFRTRKTEVRVPHSTIVSGCVFAVALLLTPLSAHADNFYDLEDPPCDPDVCDLHINTSSFANNLNGLSLSEDQAEWWITWGASNWISRTGALNPYTYAGRTSNTVDCDDPSSDGVSTIYADPGQDPRGPNYKAYFMSYGPVGGGLNDATEVDICVWGNSDDWSVQMDHGVDDYDLIGVTNHELGHLLASHKSGTMMDSGAGSVLFDPTLQRWPYGHDVAGIRGSMGWNGHQRYWQAYDFGSDSWTTSTSIPNTNLNFDVNADIGYDSTHGYQVVTTGVIGGADWTRIVWSRSSYPLDGSSTWTHRYRTEDTWQPPTTIGSRRAGMWMSAWTNSPETFNTSTSPPCHVRVATSVDAFDSYNLYTLGDSCTLHSPGLAYHGSSGRFVLVYASLDTSQDGRVYARTSTDGANWTAPQDMGFFSQEGVAAACDYYSECVFSYLRGDSLEPTTRTHEFYVDSNGTVSLGSFTDDSNRGQRTPSATETWSGTEDYLFTTIFWNYDPVDWMLGRARPYTAKASSSPFPSYQWKFSGHEIGFPADLAGSAYVTELYLFHVE